MGELKAGNSVTYENAGAAISKGAVVELKHTLGVALEDIAATTGSGEVAVEGVFDLPKVDTAVIVNGEKLVWDTSVGKFDDSSATPATGDITGAAIAVEALGATTSANIRVKLTPGNATLT